MSAALNLSGKRFGSLVVLRRAPNRPGLKLSMWDCRCDCGAAVICRGPSLVDGNTTSCGCRRKANLHSLAATRESTGEAQPASLTDERVEALAVEHEAFGFGRVGDKGLSIHGFEPEGLRAFARALAATRAADPAPDRAAMAEEAKRLAYQMSAQDVSAATDDHAGFRRATLDRAKVTSRAFEAAIDALAVAPAQAGKPMTPLSDNAIRDVLKNDPSGQRALYMMAEGVTCEQFRDTMVGIARAIERAHGIGTPAAGATETRHE